MNFIFFKNHTHTKKQQKKQTNKTKPKTKQNKHKTKQKTTPTFSIPVQFYSLKYTYWQLSLFKQFDLC